MPEVCVVAIPKSENGRKNFAYALDTQTWGFPRLREQVAGLRAGMPLLFATDFDLNGDGSPRIPRELYATGRLGRVVLATATGDLENADNPHWPDEISTGDIIYPVRFPLLPMDVAEDVSLADYPPELGFAFHWSINQQSSGNIINLGWEALDALAQHAGLDEWPRGEGSARTTPGVDPLGFVPRPKQGSRTSGAGYMQSPAARKAIEQHAVAVARAHYEGLDYVVTEFGKPFDLECVRSDETLRVEVKGTTSQAATVELTVNEVLHAQQHNTELFIVWGVSLDRLDGIPTASGGTSKIFHEWVPSPDALRPIRYQYEVPWSSAS